MPRKRTPLFHRVSLLIHKVKRFRKRKEFKLLRHYNYGEYHHPNRGQRYSCSLFYLYSCLGNFDVENSTAECHVEALPNVETQRRNTMVVVAEDLFHECSGSGDHEDETVDEKAERFIQKFYHQMRMQTQESI
ncbi:hypothetical protein RJT34_25522 [Clitoria ternatea]|uniref:Cotton fiber protein n=1 Tax=Clitoria ternatea TaxID=43366 RepID=A0AAN9FY05_CLITE